MHIKCMTTFQRYHKKLDAELQTKFAANFTFTVVIILTYKGDES